MRAGVQRVHHVLRKVLIGRLHLVLFNNIADALHTLIIPVNQTFHVTIYDHVRESSSPYISVPILTHNDV